MISASVIRESWKGLKAFPWPYFTFIATLAAATLLGALILVIRFHISSSEGKDKELRDLRKEYSDFQRRDKEEDLAHFREVRAAKDDLIREMVRHSQEAERDR